MFALALPDRLSDVKGWQAVAKTVTVPTGWSWWRVTTYTFATFFAIIGLVFLLLFLPPNPLANAAAAGVLGSLLFGAAVAFVLMDLRLSITSVVVSEDGVTYRYPVREVHVAWADIRPPSGLLGRFWTPNDPVIFTDMVPNALIPLASRPVTSAQARAIVDFPSYRSWTLEERWLRAIHSPPQTVAQWWRAAPTLVKVGLGGVILGFAIVLLAVVVVALGVVPSCAFSNYSCPTPDWFNASFYVMTASLLGGVIILEIGRFGQKNPLDNDSKM